MIVEGNESFRIAAGAVPPYAVIDDASSADARAVMAALDFAAVSRRILDLGDKSFFGEWRGNEAEKATRCRMVELLWETAAIYDRVAHQSYAGQPVTECPSPIGWMIPDREHHVVRVSWLSNVPMRLERISTKSVFQAPAFNWIAFRRTFARPTTISVACYLFWEAPIPATAGRLLEGPTQNS